MFYILSKILFVLVAPVCLSILLFLIYVLTNIKGYFWCGLFSLLFFSNPYISFRVMKWYEIAPVLIEKNKKYDAIIILGGFISNYEVDGKLRVNFSEGTDRMLQAIDLFKNGVSPRIIYTSGADTVFGNFIPESELGRNYMIKCGIPDSCIWIEKASMNTFQNAIYTKAILEQKEPGNENKKYLLITSGYHMRRALACFNKAGIPVDPYSTDLLSIRSKETILNTFIPTYGSMENWTLLLKEWIGLVVYKVKGYI